MEAMGTSAGSRSGASKVGGTLAALVMAATTLSVVAHGTSPAAASPTGQTAYVTNFYSDNVTPVSTATHAAGSPIPVGSNPLAVAITPDGSTVYVANRGDGTITPIATATNTPGAPIPVGPGPTGMAMTPDGRTLYVTTNNNEITPIATATNTAGAQIADNTGPNGIAVAPDGRTAYVANEWGNAIVPISIATNTLGSPIPVGSQPRAIAITADGSEAYVTNGGDGTVTPVSLRTRTAGPPIAVGPQPWAITLTPDGTTAYVVNAVPDGSVTPINLATRTAGAPLALGAGSFPGGLAVSADGSTLYVDDKDSVTPISTSTEAIGTPTVVGLSPLGIVLTPEPSHLTATPAVLDVANTQASLLTLTATLTSPDGPVKDARIEFSAGTTAICTSVTAADGTATCDATGAVLPIATALGYTATFRGNPGYTPALAQGVLLNP